MKVLVPLAEGFEEIEALTIIDVLRRADVQVTTLHIKSELVKGAHGISVKADADIRKITGNDYGAIVLPGGMPGSKNLLESPDVNRLLVDINENDGYLAAICAAPMVLGHAGFLIGKKATCYPGYETQLNGAEYVNLPCVVDGKIITGQGAGSALTFSLKLAEIFSGRDVSAKLRAGMMVYWKDEF